ncbi:MAG TPA: alpha/beta hydrolase [Bdellovibrionota bacterium]|nr:alpha/beta hydrolase [Bdellovibrionota bacterium]
MIESLDGVVLEHHFADVNGIRLHYVAAGPKDGKLLVLLHGFPEFWYGWRNQIPHFARLGYRVVAPDQRGYNLSDRPKAVREYTYAKLGGDIVALIQKLGGKAHVVGHDWGGAVTWWLASHHPEVLSSVTILNCTRPDVLERSFLHSRSQLRKSWYMFAFQIPLLPELRMARKNFDIGRRGLRSTSRKGTFSSEELDLYAEAWSRPGSLRGMINWYRAAIRGRRQKFVPIQVPLKLIWGKKDRFLDAAFAEPSLAGCSKAEVVYLDEASHWLQHEEPARVNREIEKWLARLGLN